MALQTDEPGAAGAPEAERAPAEGNAMKPVATMFVIANVAVLAVFAALVATGWVDVGVAAVAAPSAS